VGKGSRGAGGIEMLNMFLPGRSRKMSCCLGAGQPGPGMLEGAQGQRWAQKDQEKLVTKGWQP